MHFKNLTFNDLPTVVGELCKRIENLETVLKNSLAVQNKVKENHHVPMTVDEVCIPTLAYPNPHFIIRSSMGAFL